jgi:hypothetical protein
MIGVCSLNFILQWIFLFNLAILIRKHFCQIDDFTMRLWHLNKIHFVENPKRYKKWTTLVCIHPSTNDAINILKIQWV